MEAQESGDSVLNSLPTADVLFERMAGSDVELGARYGLFEEDGVERSVDTDEAALEFQMLLRHHLERVKSATDERGIRLIVENMSSRPEQQQVLEEICADLEIADHDTAHAGIGNLATNNKSKLAPKLISYPARAHGVSGHGVPSAA